MFLEQIRKFASIVPAYRFRFQISFLYNHEIIYPKFILKFRTRLYLKRSHASQDNTKMASVKQKFWDCIQFLMKILQTHDNSREYYEDKFGAVPP